jgi:DNA-binding transcriptional regulator YiaG
MDIRSAEFLAKRQAQEVAKEKGLLSPEEIKGIRKSLGLKQHDFETLIGVSSPTASRWETGAMLPSKTTDTLIRVLAEFPEVVEFLSSRSLDATFAVDATVRVGCPSAQRPQLANYQVLEPWLIGEPKLDSACHEEASRGTKLRLAA